MTWWKMLLLLGGLQHQVHYVVVIRKLIIVDATDGGCRLLAATNRSMLVVGASWCVTHYALQGPDEQAPSPVIAQITCWQQELMQ